MSLVGTRPILQDELLKYELHHRARIAIKPGITGMWQVSGRSDITDFEEVVRLDTEYISNITYRVYDYDRVDKNGKKRELHFDKAVQVMKMKVAPDVSQKPRIQNLHTLNRKCASTLQSLRYLVPTISERRVFPKYCIKRENQCRSRAAAEIPGNEAMEE